MHLNTLRADVVRYAKKLSASGLVRHTQGNVSARDTASGLICITPSGTDYELLTPDDVVVVDEAGAVVEGRWAPSVETPTHARIYRQRSDVHAIIHAHAPHATAFGIAYQAIPMVLMEAAMCLGGSVPVAPYLMSGSEQFAALVADVLGGGQALVWGNHGILVAGPTLNQALAMAHALEDNAQAYLLARQLGEPHVLPDDEVARLHRFWLDKYGQHALPAEPTTDVTGG